jgi:hypothetical protein
MTETIQNTTKEGSFKRELTKEEKKARNRLYYLKFIEKCRNHEFLTVEERQADRTQGTAISPEEKKEATAIRRRLTTNRYRLKHKEEWNDYMRNRMKDRYRNDEVYRTKQLENAKRRRALKKEATNEQKL